MAKPDPEALAKALRENLRKRKAQGRDSPLPGRFATCPSPLSQGGNFSDSLPAGGGEGNASGASEGEVTAREITQSHLSLLASQAVPPRLRQGGKIEENWQQPTTAEARAWALRRYQTGPEQLLWARLRAGRLNGHKFRRQVPLGPYIADFVCHQAKLVIEVDDSGHAEAAAYDARRTAWLEGEGWRVLRVWNNDVTQRMDGVLEAVLRAAEGW